MPVSFDLSEHHLPDVVRFAYSPLLDCVLSLHVLTDPTHHPVQHQWVRKARQLPADLRAQIDRFAFVFASGYPCCAFPDARTAPAAFASEVARIADLDPSLAAFEFGASLVRDAPNSEPDDFLRADTRAALVAGANELQGAPRDAAHTLINEPGEFTSELAEFLVKYWDSAFREEWEAIEPLLQHAVRDGAHHIARDGIAAFVTSELPRGATLNDAGHLTVTDRADHTIVLSPERPLVLCPSIFIWPHRGINRHAPFSNGIVYPAPAARDQSHPAAPPNELVAQLEVLADATRLRILRLVAQRPRSTQELAPLLHLSEGTLSRHLQRLTSVGLIEPERDSYWVLYSAAADGLHMIEHSLHTFLGE